MFDNGARQRLEQPQTRAELEGLPVSGLAGADIFPNAADAGFDEYHDLTEEVIELIRKPGSKEIQ